MIYWQDWALKWLDGKKPPIHRYGPLERLGALDDVYQPMAFPVRMPRYSRDRNFLMNVDICSSSARLT